MVDMALRTDFGADLPAQTHFSLQHTALHADKWKPQSAMVMAAGYGRRMRPLTDRVPKPLIEIMGRPLIDHAIERLTKAGVSVIVANCHYLADQLEDHLERCYGDMIRLSDERDTLMDTGGGIRKALPLLGPDPFYLLNSDSLWLEGAQPNLERLAAGFDADRMDAILLLAPASGAIGYSGRGDFLMSPDGKLSRRPERQLAPFVYTGCAIINPRLLDDTPDVPFSVNMNFDRAIEAERLFGLRMDGIWMHVGDADAVALAEQCIRDSAI